VTTRRSGRNDGQIQLKPGTRLRSATDETELIVIRAPAEPIDLRCGGHPVLPHEAAPSAVLPIDSAHAGGCALGKRYVNEDGTLEVLCTKAGEGGLSVGEVALTPKAAKPLPSSD
jgi:hypothetical protein